MSPPGIAGSLKQVHQNCLRPAMVICLSSCQISLCSTKPCTRNVLQIFFTHLWILVDPFGPKFTNLGINVQQGRSITVSRSDNLCTRYLLTNFVDFVDSVADKQTKKQQTISLHILCGHNNEIFENGEPERRVFLPFRSEISLYCTEQRLPHLHMNNIHR